MGDVKVDCPSCDGTGTKPIWSDDAEDWMDSDCGFCNGKGWYM